MAEDSDDDFLTYRIERPQKTLDPTLMATTCAGIVVLLVGLGFLFGAIANHRLESVEDYQHEVRAWEEFDRPKLQETQLKMSMTLPATAHQAGGLLQGELKPEEEDDWTFHDTEQMEGVQEYHPLKHIMNLELPCLYPNCSMVTLNAINSLQAREDWNSQVLPSWEDAPRASFHFVATGGGKQSSFSTPEIPLVFDLPTVGQTPQPRLYCYGPGHGVFRRPGTCHHAQRLTELCLVLQPDEASGGWKLRDAEVQSLYYNYSRRTGTFGCNPQTGYEATTYRRDPCWGPVPNRHLCQEDGTTHQVRITVRAWHDPYIKAAELTHGSFDFGLSPSTETICGSVLFTMGCLIILVPNVLRSRCLARRFKTLTRKAASPKARALGRQAP